MLMNQDLVKKVRDYFAMQIIVMVLNPIFVDFRDMVWNYSFITMEVFLNLLKQ